MAGGDDGELEFIAELAKKLHDFQGDGEIESAGGFVEKEDFWLGGKGAGEGEPTAFTTGKTGGGFAEVGGIETNGVEDASEGRRAAGEVESV